MDRRRLGARRVRFSGWRVLLYERRRAADGPDLAERSGPVAACLNIDAIAAETQICQRVSVRCPAGMKRSQPDVYTDTMLWIMDGRRSWNRRRGKKKGKQGTRRARSP